MKPAKTLLPLVLILSVVILVVFVAIALIYNVFAGNCVAPIDVRTKDGQLKNGVRCGIKTADDQASNISVIGRIENFEENNNKIYISVNLGGLKERFFVGEKGVDKLYILKMPFSDIPELGEQKPDIYELTNIKDLNLKFKNKFTTFFVSLPKDKSNKLLLYEDIKTKTTDPNVPKIVEREKVYWDTCTSYLNLVTTDLLNSNFESTVGRLYRYNFESGNRCIPFISSFTVYQ